MIGEEPRERGARTMTRRGEPRSAKGGAETVSGCGKEMIGPRGERNVHARGDKLLGFLGCLGVREHDCENQSGPMSVSRDGAERRGIKVGY